MLPLFMKLGYIMSCFFMLREYREGKKQLGRDKRFKDKSWKRKNMSHNVLVFMVLHQAEERLLNMERVG